MIEAGHLEQIHYSDYWFHDRAFPLLVVYCCNLSAAGGADWAQTQYYVLCLLQSLCSPCPKSELYLLIIGSTISQSNQQDGMLQALLSSLFLVKCNY